MEYFTRLIYTLLVIIISIPALSSIFIFFGISLEVYASYLLWLAAVAIFSSILAPNTEIPKLITLLDRYLPDKTQKPPPNTAVPPITVAPVPSKTMNMDNTNTTDINSIIPVKGFFNNLIGITEPSSYNTEPPVTSKLIGNTNNINTIIPVKGVFNKLTDIFKSDNTTPSTFAIKTTASTPKPKIGSSYIDRVTNWWRRGGWMWAMWPG